MRAISVFLMSLLLAGAAAAQKPAEPVGNLAEVMRAILFPNSNFLFDVQSQDPGKPPESDGSRETTSQMFSGIYKGWMVVEQAAIALAEVEPLIMMDGRKCQNGKPVPADKEDFAKWASELTEVAKNVYEAAKAKDRDAVIELTNDVAGACELCHERYRRYEDRCR